MGRMGTALLTIALVACQAQPGTQSSAQPKGASGPVRDILAHASALATASGSTDARFESFIATMDLNKLFGARAAEIIDQLRATRAAVTKAKRASRGQAGGRLASVAAVTGEWAVEYFADKLATGLDALTTASGTAPSTPFHTSSTSSGPTTETTTTLDLTEVLSGAGGRVSLTAKWTVKTITKDKATGDVLYDGVEDRTMTGAIKVCPAEDGSVVATIDVHTKFTTASGAVKTSLDAKSGSVLTGHVDQSAVLGSVSQTLQDNETLESVNVSGTYESTVTVSYAANASGSFSGARDQGSAQGNTRVSDAGSAALADFAYKSTGQSLHLDAVALDSAFQEAERLWRNGRCVVVRAPDFNAETPIEIDKQNKPQHDEAVDVGSEKKFSVSLRARFGGSVTAPVTASLSGDKKLEPTRLDSGSGSLTYTAPDEPDKEATATLKSTSNRGIGTLVLDFHTEGKTLTLNIRGSHTITAASQQIITSIAIGPAMFKKVDDKWQATAPYSGNTSFAPPPYDCEDLKITESGTVQFTATVETRGQSKFWVIHSDLGGTTKVTGSGCKESESYGSGLFGGAFTGLFIAAVGDIAIPFDGGTVPVSGSSAAGGRVAGTAVGTVTQKK